MTLTLLAVSLNDRPLSQPITAHFGPEGGTIGRADHNTMALPDPERHISRLQAEIIASGHQFQIRNVGAANPISVAGRPVAAGESVPLRHGHEVRIGGYQLKVVDDASADRTGGDVTRGRAAVMAQTAKAAQDARGVNPDPIASGSPFSTSAGFGPVPPRPGPRSGGGLGPLPETAASPLSDSKPLRRPAGPVADVRDGEDLVQQTRRHRPVRRSDARAGRCFRGLGSIGAACGCAVAPARRLRSHGDAGQVESAPRAGGRRVFRRSLRRPDAVRSAFVDRSIVRPRRRVGSRSAGRLHGRRGARQRRRRCRSGAGWLVDRSAGAVWRPCRGAHGRRHRPIRFRRCRRRFRHRARSSLPLPSHRPCLRRRR
jgi:hypothetical protein